MKKKFLTLFLFVIASTCCIFGLSACDNASGDTKIAGIYDLEEIITYKNYVYSIWNYEFFKDGTVEEFVAGHKDVPWAEMENIVSKGTYTLSKNKLKLNFTEGKKGTASYRYDVMKISNSNITLTLTGRNSKGELSDGIVEPDVKKQGYGGVYGNPLYVQEGKSIKLTATPDNGEEFISWSDGITENPRTFTNVQAGFEITAHFTKNYENEYRITYHADGGTIREEDKNSFTGKTLPLVLPLPEKDGYDFIGWYDNAQFTGNKYTSIGKYDYGNKEFYAKFEKRDYCEYELSDDGTYYIASGDRDKIYRYFPKVIEIASSYNGLPVKAVSDFAFSQLSVNAEVIVPDSVTYIGKRAFISCRGISKVNIPNGVTYIGEAAFYMSGVEEILIPSSVEYIGKNAFDYCDKLRKVTILTKNSNGYLYVGNNAFHWCQGVTFALSGNSPIYYHGEKSEESSWTFLIEEGNQVKIYYYSETAPQTQGNYWHYGTDNEMILW